MRDLRATLVPDLEDGVGGIFIAQDFPGDRSPTVEVASPGLPSIFTARHDAQNRRRDFFISHIRNPNTRRAYTQVVLQFSAFCSKHGIVELAHVDPIHVATFVEVQLKLYSKPTVKQHLAALRMLCDWMVVGQIIPTQSCPRGTRAEALAAARKDAGAKCR